MFKYKTLYIDGTTQLLKVVGAQNLVQKLLSEKLQIDMGKDGIPALMPIICVTKTFKTKS